jgi:CBS domain-containing protein
MALPSGTRLAVMSRMSIVRDAMVREVVAVASDTSLDAVARLLALNDISGAPVVDDDGRPMGVVSQRDLIDAERPRSGREGRTSYYRVWNGDVRAIGLLGTTPPPVRGVAADVMSSPLMTIDAGAGIDEAARRMLRGHIHRLFVVERGKVVGLVTALDCLRALVGAGPL